MASINKAYIEAMASLNSLTAEMNVLNDKRHALQLLQTWTAEGDKEFMRVVASKILKLAFEIRKYRAIVDNSTVFVNAAAMMRILKELESEITVVDHPLFAIGAELNDKLAKDLKDLVILPILDDTIMYHRDIKRLSDAYLAVKKLVS